MHLEIREKRYTSKIKHNNYRSNLIETSTTNLKPFKVIERLFLQKITPDVSFHLHNTATDHVTPPQNYLPSSHKKYKMASTHDVHPTQHY